MTSYPVIIQAGPDEILTAPSINDLCLAQIQSWPDIREFVVALPNIENAATARDKLLRWGFRCLIGDPYNVCNRILEASRFLGNEKFCVRVLATWKHMDLEYVNMMVEQMRRLSCDYIAAPRDFDITMAADVASLAAIRRIGLLPGGTAQEMRARFNPWGYIEMHPDLFSVKYLEPAPCYDAARRNAILLEKRCFPENEYYGRDYKGSRYHHLLQYLPSGQRILDIACGSGSGTELISRTSAFTVGVDYLETYIKKARERYPENDRLRFITGDGQSFLYENKEGQFDVIVSFHTLEHAQDDDSMVSAFYRNLRPGGELIVEVPLQMARPLGVPINPYHLREYKTDEFVVKLRRHGFEILNLIGGNRDFYGDIENARDAVQVRAVKSLPIR